MKIAIIGGGASGMATAHLLQNRGHQITVYEKQSQLGGNIKTLNQNVINEQLNCDLHLECGVLEFPYEFRHFRALMHDLNIEIEPVQLGTALFLNNGNYILSSAMIRNNLRGMSKIKEYAKLAGLFFPTLKLLFKTLANNDNLHPQSMQQFLQSESLQNTWLKLLGMYSYSIAFKLINNMPAALLIPSMRKYMFTNWYRIKGGTYSYIKKIVDGFDGDIIVNSDIFFVDRSDKAVNITFNNGSSKNFDKIVFATTPEQVLKLLSDPSKAEIKRFGSWKVNRATTTLHTDATIYDRYSIEHSSEFDFFQVDGGWGYNCTLNQLCDIHSNTPHYLAFNLDSLIAKDHIIHQQEHQTPLYTVDAIEYRDEVIDTNGENNTYHVGAYLFDGLHEGAITSAMNVAQLINEN